MVESSLASRYWKSVRPAVLLTRLNHERCLAFKLPAMMVRAGVFSSVFWLDVWRVVFRLLYTAERRSSAL